MSLADYRYSMMSVSLYDLHLFLNWCSEVGLCVIKKHKQKVFWLYKRIYLLHLEMTVIHTQDVLTHDATLI